MVFWDQLGWVGRCQLGAYVISGSEWAGEKHSRRCLVWITGTSFFAFASDPSPPPPAGVGGGSREEVVMPSPPPAPSPRRRSRTSLRHTALLYQPRTIWSRLGRSPACGHLSGGCGKVKGSLTCLGHSSKTPEAWPDPASNASFPPPPPSPALQPGGSHTCGHLLFRGTTRNSYHCQEPRHSWGADYQWFGKLCPQPGFLIRCLPGSSDHPLQAAS